MTKDVYSQEEHLQPDGRGRREPRPGIAAQLQFGLVALVLQGV